MKDANPNKKVFARRLLGKLYDMGLVPTADTLERVDNVSASSFCRRRLPSMMMTVGLMNNVSLTLSYFRQLFRSLFTQLFFRFVNPLSWSRRDMCELVRLWLLILLIWLRVNFPTWLPGLQAQKFVNMCDATTMNWTIMMIKCSLLKLLLHGYCYHCCRINVIKLYTVYF